MTTLPTREQIAAAIHDGPGAQAQYAEHGIPPHPFGTCAYREQYLLDADAVLALLVARGDLAAGRAETPAGCPLRARIQELADNQQTWIDAGRSGQAVSRDVVRDTLRRALSEYPCRAETTTATVEQVARLIDPDAWAAHDDPTAYPGGHDILTSPSLRTAQALAAAGLLATARTQALR